MAIWTHYQAMTIGPIQRWLTSFVIGASLCADFGRVLSRADAAPIRGTAAIAMDTGSVAMPRKSNLPNGFSDIGGIFMAALPPAYTPPAYTPPATQLAWSRIVYASVIASHAGMSLEPTLGPPIHV